MWYLRGPGDDWAVREDVRVRCQREDGPLETGPLTLGFTAYGGRRHFGPGFGFGHVVGDHCAAPVVLLETAWGRKSLYRGLRPPSSGGSVGPYYTRILADIRAGLKAAATELPDHPGRVELAGLSGIRNGMTEAFFGSNAFQPFNRADLRTAEPATYDLVESLWRKDASAIAHRRQGAPRPRRTPDRPEVESRLRESAVRPRFRP